MKLMIEKMRALTYQRQGRHLREIDFLILNDLSAFYNRMYGEKRKEYWKNLKERLLHRLDTLPVIEPNNKLRILMDVLLMCLTTFLIFMFSTDICFDQEVLDLINTTPVKTVYLTFYIIEVFLSFLTGQTHNGVQIRNFRKISSHYLKTSFFPDIIVIVALFTGIRGSVANLLVGFKIFSLSNHYNRLNSLLVLNENITHILGLLKLVFGLMIVSHFIGLLWFLLARWEVSQGEEENWLAEYKVLDEAWYMQYIVAFYW